MRTVLLVVYFLLVAVAVFFLAAVFLGWVASP